jgi:hypothetical protein
MAKKSNKPQAASRFPVGSRVRVKPGVTVPDFEDIPLGGWAGAVTEVDQRGPTTYQIEWDRHTMENMHPAFRGRCDREGLGVESMWLGENDLVPDDGSPPTIERPTALKSRPLDLNDGEDRVRALFGVRARDEPIPRVGLETLRRFHGYLAEHLAFPFEGQLSDPIGPHRDTRSPLSVIRLLDVDTYCPEEMYGLIVKAKQNGKRIELPLEWIDVKEDSPHSQLLGDYRFWMANCQ